GGLLYGNANDEAAGVAALRVMVDQLTADQREVFYREVIYPPSLGLVNSAAAAGDEPLFRFLELIKAGAPILRDIFDFSAAVPDIDIYAIRGRGRLRSKLLNFRSPPPGQQRTARRAVVAMRTFVFPADPASRTFDGGPRIAAAMNAYGWRATHFKMNWRSLAAEYEELTEYCRQEQPEVLVLDDHLIEY